MPAGCIYGETPCFHPALFGRLAHSVGMTILRATMRWSGFTGEPGYTNLHFSKSGDIDGAVLDATLSNCRTFFQAFSSRLPTSVGIVFTTTVDEFDTTSGELLNTHSAVLQTQVTGTGGTSPFSSATGACVTWGTDSIVNGRRLRGRTFMVPLLPSAAFESNGSLIEVARAAFQAAAVAFKNETDGYPFHIWHQPDPGVTNGASGPVTSASVADKTAILRSRRD